MTRLPPCWKLIVGLIAMLAARPAPAADAPVFYIIPHTHWEGAVFITREEYLEQGLPHILTVLRLLKEHPNFRFTLDQVEYFRPFLERYPEEAGAFRQFVAEGRLAIVGGLDIMPDDNMPSGESFVRQILYAKGYCREALGTEVKTEWLLDTFGHHAQLPQILRLAGFDSFWFARGVNDPDHMPSEFLWQGLDGTRIPAFWVPHGYANVYNPPGNLRDFSATVENAYNSLAVNSRNAPERAGLDGADVTDPELYLPDMVHAFNAQTNKPFTIRLAVPSDFEAAVAYRKDSLPVNTGERNPLFQGVYSTRIELKERMRETERLLTSAEKMGALSQWTGEVADRQTLWRAWEPALFNVTHDLASGVMTDHVYEDVNRGYDFAQRLGSDLLEASLRDVVKQTDTTGEGVALAVFNTLGWTRTDAAQADVGFAEGGIKDFKVVDAHGREVPAQLTSSDPFVDGGLRRIQFTFVARDVPAMGCAVYHVLGLKTAHTPAAPENTPADALENEFYRATVDLKTGALTSLRLKKDDWEALAAPANVIAEETDHGDVWELYTTLNAEQKVMKTHPIRAPDPKEAHFSNQESGAPGALQHGAVFDEFHVNHPFGKGTFATTVRLYRGVPRVEFETSLVNNDQFVRYRLMAPTSVQNGRNFQEIPFGAIERPVSQEFPAQNWCDYSDDSHGVTLVNRGLPGNNVAGGVMLLSLLRSTEIQTYGNFNDEQRSSHTAFELGRERTFHYALAPHTGDWRESAAYRQGLEFNNPFIVRPASTHRGSLPATWGLFDLSPGNVVLSAFKLSGDGSAILRVYEAAGQPTRAALALHAKTASAHEANLMEDAGEKLKMTDNVIHFDLHPFEIKTFKLQIRARSFIGPR